MAAAAELENWPEGDIPDYLLHFRWKAIQHLRHAARFLCMLGLAVESPSPKWEEREDNGAK
jgi:hypothetical protein